MAVQTSTFIPKVTILYPGGDQLSSLPLEREKNTVIGDLIEKLCTLRAIETKNIQAYNEVGKKIDPKLTIDQSNTVFIELIDKKSKKKVTDADKAKSQIDDAGAGKIRKGKPEAVVVKIGQGVNLPLKQQLFDDEWESLQNFKSKHEITKSYTDEFIMCCLWSRKFDESRTLKLLQDNLQWRKSNGFDKIPSISEVEGVVHQLIEMQTMIPGSRDKNGGGIVYVNIKKEFTFGKEPMTVDNLRKWIAWYYYVGIFYDGLDNLRQGVTIIEDLTELGWNHFDLDVQKQLNVSSIFPLRLRRCIVINPPAIFSAIIKISKTFVSAKLLNRIETTNKVKDVLNYITPDQLWTQFGGELDFSPKNGAEQLIAWGHKNEAYYQVPINY